MELQKIRISPHGKSNFSAFSVLFNPSQYTIAKANQIAEVGIPGLGAPILQYVRGNTRTLAMDLFLDTYEEQSDVTAKTKQIYNLLEMERSTHAPPICDVRWGSFLFTGVLDHVSGQYTLFLSDGTPVRATLGVQFKEYIEIDVLVMQNPTESVDHYKTYTVRLGDRVDLLAAEEYGDPQKWRVIADANNLDHPGRLQAGQTLILPSLR